MFLSVNLLNLEVAIRLYFLLIWFQSNSCFMYFSHVSASVQNFCLRSAHTMGLVPATSPCNKSQGLVALCELATSPCD